MSPLPITADWTLGELKTKYPAVELALFAHFGIGSRQRSGFSRHEKLGDLLRRYLVFETEQACRRLSDLAAEDARWGLTPKELSQRGSGKNFELIDVRGPEEFRVASLDGAVLLSAAEVERRKAQPERAVLCFCNDGSQAPAASRHLRTLGLEAHHLQGGLFRWSEEVDGELPILFPLREVPGMWHLLSDGVTFRYRYPLREPFSKLPDRWVLWSREELLESRWGNLLLRLPDLCLVAASPRSLSFRFLKTPTREVIPVLLPSLLEPEVWSLGGTLSEELVEEAKLTETLAVEAPRILSSHKGTVELESYCDRVLTLRLGGGCAGCASAEITAQRELSAALYLRVPLLDSIQALS